MLSTALSFGFCAGTNDALGLLWGLRNSISSLPLLHWQEETNLPMNFSKWKLFVKLSVPYWQRAHQCISNIFWGWKKIKTGTTILQSKELKLILTLHEFCLQSHSFACSSHLIVLPDCPTWQQMFSIASCNFGIESHCNLNTADGHFNFYLFSYSGFQIQ